MMSSTSGVPPHSNNCCRWVVLTASVAALALVMLLATGTSDIGVAVDYDLMPAYDDRDREEGRDNGGGDDSSGAAPTAAANSTPTNDASLSNDSRALPLEPPITVPHVRCVRGFSTHLLLAHQMHVWIDEHSNELPASHRENRAATRRFHLYMPGRRDDPAVRRQWDEADRVVRECVAASSHLNAEMVPFDVVDPHVSEVECVRRDVKHSDEVRDADGRRVVNAAFGLLLAPHFFHGNWGPTGLAQVAMTHAVMEDYISSRALLGDTDSVRGRFRIQFHELSSDRGSAHTDDWWRHGMGEYGWPWPKPRCVVGDWVFLGLAGSNNVFHVQGAPVDPDPWVAELVRRGFDKLRHRLQREYGDIENVTKRPPLVAADIRKARGLSVAAVEDAWRQFVLPTVIQDTAAQHEDVIRVLPEGVVPLSLPAAALPCAADGQQPDGVVQLCGYGAIQDLGKLPMAEQWRIMRGASVFLTAEGAGVGWGALAPRDVPFTLILVLQPGRVPHFHLSQPYIFRYRMIVFLLCRGGDEGEAKGDWAALQLASDKAWAPGVTVVNGCTDGSVSEASVTSTSDAIMRIVARYDALLQSPNPDTPPGSRVSADVVAVQADYLRSGALAPAPVTTPEPPPPPPQPHEELADVVESPLED